MHYRVLACDYDGTIAEHGRVTPATIAAMRRLQASGRKLVLVTGRQVDELLAILPELDLFASVVAENGALLYDPATRADRLLGPAPPANFVESLRLRQVSPLAVGRAIVASWKPHEIAILEAIRDQGLDLQVIFNKEAVMVLPAGVNKATGLEAALSKLGVPLLQTVGVGDAENDLIFLSTCGFSAAVANALPAVQERVDWVTPGDHGKGVEELIEALIANDLKGLPRKHTSAS
jgi:hydroxymethylpyrimidine pyrophosphatase-like HAD family hydrolase